MSLAIFYDIADLFVAEKAFAIQDALLRQRDPGQFSFAGTWPIPGGKAVTLFPDQLRTDWGQAAGKWGAADWTYPTTRYDLLQRRGAADWFFASKGLASAVTGAGQYTNVGIPLTSVAALPENGGLFVEFWGYGVSGTRTPDLLQVGFAGGLTLHIHSDGSADLYDARPGSTPGYLAQGLPLTGQSSALAGALGSGGGAGTADLLGKLVSVLILPYRRGKLLIVTNQGGCCEVGVGGRDDTTDAYKGRRGYNESAYHLTTDAGPVTLTPSPRVRALVAANPLTCRQAMTGSLTSPIVHLPRDVATGPDQVTGEADAQDGSAATLAVVDALGLPFAPDDGNRASALAYQISLTTQDPRVFPVFYSLEMKWARVMGERTYGTNVIPTKATPTGNAISANLTMSRDRAQKSFSMVIDNPDDHYTSLKDAYNRLVLVALDSGGADAAFGVPSGEGLLVFTGLSGPAEFVDGRSSQLRIPVESLRKRLRSHLLSNSQKHDGMLDTVVVRTILVDAGVKDEDIITADEAATALDSAAPGDDPLWLPESGQSADDDIQHIADTFSGWVFDQIGPKYYYVPREYFTLAAIAQNGGVIPTVYQETPMIGGAGGPGVPATRTVNTGVLVALKDSVKQTTEEPRANDFFVIGQDDDGNLFNAHWEDADGIKELGERRTLVYASGSITTLAAAYKTLGALLPLSRPLVNIEFSLPDYQITQLPLEGPVVVDGFAPGVITSIDSNLDRDRNRVTKYTYEVQ